MIAAKVQPSFWKGKRVFLTGHTGFKGSWLAFWLSSMGAKVIGYSLPPISQPNLYEVLKIENLIEKSHFADIRDPTQLHNAIIDSQAQVVIHMAAQTIVRYSYKNPVETYSTNVMGTVNLLESLRGLDSARATVIVTTDKCYENQEWEWGYREKDPLGGFDPYSSSKGCAELVTAAYRQSFFSDQTRLAYPNAIASARAGNVIGGGDWSEDRIIPDAIRAFESNQTLVIRNPLATRPWQHVLEPLSGYLILAQALYEKGPIFASSWNFGPKDDDISTVEDLINTFINIWGNGASWEKENTYQPHEAQLLKLDCSKARQQLHWLPKWDIKVCLEKIILWQRSFQSQDNMQIITLNQINEYLRI